MFSINAENVAQGSVGLAVIVANSHHRVIIYRTKQEVLSTFTLIGPGSVINFKNEYIQYHDDVSQFWSIRFTKNEERDAFFGVVHTWCSIEKESVPQIENPPPVSVNNVESISQPTLIDRMAKMGHQILPNNVLPAQAISSDSDDIESDPPHRKPILANKWKPDVPSRALGNSHLQYPAGSTLISYNPVHTLGNSSSADMVSLFTENRFQNTEVRMCLSKLESKIERVLDKVESIRDATNSSPKPRCDLEEEIIQLEEKLLAFKKENRQLRMGRDADSQADKALRAEQQKSSLLEAQLGEQTIELEKLRSSVATKEAQIQQLESERLLTDEHSRTQTGELQAKLKGLSSDKTASNATIATLKSRIGELEANQLTNEAQLSQLQSQAKSNGNESGDLVKDIMNNMYQSVHETVADRRNWSADEVLKIMRTVIKRETMKVLGEQTNYS